MTVRILEGSPTVKTAFTACDTAKFTNETWLTPPSILAPLGRFDLDPCAAPSPRPWPTAEQHIELPQDGLAAGWAGRIWCNPPYGAQASRWLDKLAAHGNGIALVFARTETAMFQDHVWPRASAVLFLRGRISFCDRNGKPAGNAAAPSCLIAYGEANAGVLATCGISGHCVRLQPACVSPRMDLFAEVATA
jgi:hypothetical protein